MMEAAVTDHPQDATTADGKTTYKSWKCVYPLFNSDFSLMEESMLIDCVR